jgi:hypothetical protein
VPSKLRADWLWRADKRYGPVRAVVEHAQAVALDLGGADNLTTIARDLILRLAFNTAQIEEAEAAALRGEPVDTPTYFARLDRAMRLASTLGLERRARELPSLRDIVAEHAAQSRESEGGS